MQDPLAVTTNRFRSPSLSAALKVGTLVCGSKSLLPGDKLGVGGSLLIVWHCAGGGAKWQ